MVKEPNGQSGFNKIGGYISLTIDFIMVFLVIINLLFVVFDSSFNYVFVQERIKDISEEFYVYYRDEIHPNFLLYDSIFVIIFISELMIQWIISIIAKTYSKWWIYPFANWYDVLGCVPAGTFIWLRLFRIFAMIIRLHKMGTINLRKTYFYKVLYEYYHKIVQDITDRTLIKVIDGVQRGVKHQSSEHVVADAIRPYKEELAKVLSEKIQSVIDNNYHEHEDDLKEQIEEMIQTGFENSEGLKKLEHIPVIGSRILHKLEDLVSDVSFQLADSLTKKLASDEMAALIEKVVETSLDTMTGENIKTKRKEDQDLNDIITSIIDNILQEIKEDIDRNRRSRLDILEPEN